MEMFAGQFTHDALNNMNYFGAGSFIVCLPVLYCLLWISHQLKTSVGTTSFFGGLFALLVVFKVYEVFQRRLTKARLRLRLHEYVGIKILKRLKMSGRIDNIMKPRKKRRRVMLKKPPRAVLSRRRQCSVLFTACASAVIFVFLIPMVRAARSVSGRTLSSAETVAVAAAGAFMAGAAQVQVGDEDEVDGNLSVVNPTLPDGTTLDLPADKTNYIYTRKEVIEIVLVHGEKHGYKTKTRLLAAIDAWAKEMKKENRLKRGTHQFGPSLTTLKKFFMIDNKVAPFTVETVRELLADFEEGSEAWKQRVELIAKCGQNSPGDVDQIYSMLNYVAKPCVTPESTDQTFSFSASSTLDEDGTQEDQTFSVSPLSTSDEDGTQEDQTFSVSPLSTSNEDGTQEQEGVCMTVARGNTDHSFSSLAPANSDEVNKENWNKGRWTEEELAFADRLISEFSNGLIPVPTGTTVTELLQAALHCVDNTRISARLGKQYGIRSMQPFVRDRTWWYKMTDSDIDEKMSELKDLEESFLKANFVDREKVPPAPIFGSLLENTFEPNCPLRSQLTVAHAEFSSVTTDTGLMGNLWNLLRKYVNGTPTPTTTEISDDDEGSTGASASDDEGDEDAECASTTNDKPRQSRKRRQGQARMAAAATRSKTVLNDYDTLNNAASKLDFDASPRISRGGGGTKIHVHKKKLPSEDLRWQILYFTGEVMSEANLEPKMRKKVLPLVAKLLFYDHGYEYVKGISTMDKRWKKQLNDAFLDGSTQDHPLRADYKGRKSLVAKIELEHPGLMLKLFRKAQKTIGNQATYAELAIAMKNLAKTDQMGGHDLPLSRGIVYRWFRCVGGKEKSPKPKPYLTDDQKRGRKLWCETEKERIEEEGDNYYACFLDEKWFYTQSLRRKIKYLPAMAGEEGVEYEVPRTISRRNVAKVMFLGVVANPIPDRNFDGKIFLKRISELRTYERRSCNQNFSDCAITNARLKDGAWREMVSDGMELSDLREALEVQFGLEEDIADRLVLRFYVPGRDENTKKCMYIENDNATVPDVDNLDGYTLMVKFEKGDKREVDVSCESNFMEATMPQVGRAIRDAYSWVDEGIPIYLYLDNAGGHGTDAVVERYVNLLKEDYNVICVHQHPRSPETNMLDLGVWMALQNVVERLHYKKRHSPDAIARSVNHAWRDLEEIKLSNVFRRWKFVLDLIIEDDGDNLKVESKRGKLFRAPSDEAETVDAAETIDAADHEALDGVDALGDEDEEADRLDKDPGYIEPLDCWEEMPAGDGLISKCCAKTHCNMSDKPLANTHRCLNCRGIMHGICGVEWDGDELSSNGFNISKTSLSEEGQIYLNEQHTMYDICLQCCEDLTQ